MLRKAHYGKWGWGGRARQRARWVRGSGQRGRAGRGGRRSSGGLALGADGSPADPFVDRDGALEERLGLGEAAARAVVPGEVVGHAGVTGPCGHSPCPSSRPRGGSGRRLRSRGRRLQDGGAIAPHCPFLMQGPSPVLTVPGGQASRWLVVLFEVPLVPPPLLLPRSPLVLPPATPGEELRPVAPVPWPALPATATALAGGERLAGETKAEAGDAGRAGQAEREAGDPGDEELAHGRPPFADENRRTCADVTARAAAEPSARVTKQPVEDWKVPPTQRAPVGTGRAHGLWSTTPR